MKNSMKKSLAVLAGGAMLMVASFAANANLITNGNFATGDTTGWGFGGAATVLPYINYGLVGSVAGSPNGALLGFADQGPTGFLSQVISTVAGISYTLTFNYGSYSANPVDVQSLGIAVVDTGTTGSLFSGVVSTASSSNVLSSIYTVFPTFTFTAIGASTLLKFSDLSTFSIAVDGFLTNIAVNARTVNAVPLPGTLMLLAVAFVGLVASRRIRV